MNQQILIIGLGQFGMSLARRLSEKSAEVLAVDINKDLVEEASSFVAEALTLDATDEKSLLSINPRSRDSAVCAIGNDHKEASIICTALLRQMGVPNVVARAYDKTHQRILKLVGAHEIVNPEQEFGKRFANRLLYKDLVIKTDLGDDLQLTEISVAGFMVGSNLIELSLPTKFGVTVVGVRHHKSERISLIDPTTQLNQNDTLIIVAQDSSIASLMGAL